MPPNKQPDCRAATVEALPAKNWPWWPWTGFCVMIKNSENSEFGDFRENMW